VKLRYGLSYVAAAILAACSGGSHASAVLPSTQQPGGAGTSASSSSFVYDTSALQGATLVQAASNLTSISIDLVPKMQNASGLVQYAKSVNDPHSGMYRHFLTPQEIGNQFGASESTYAAAVKYFQSQGLSVATWPQRMLLHVTGSQAHMQAALHTTFGWYSNGKSVFLAPMSTPAPPASANVAGSSNIVMQTSASTNYVALATSSGSSVVYGYSPQQIAAAFDYTGAYAAGYTGAGITAGVIGTGGFNAGDVPAYKSMFGVGGSGTVTMVSATDANAPGDSATGFATPPPITRPCNSAPAYSPSPTCNPEDYETQLDTEQIASLAPDANLHYYLAYNPNDGCGAIDTACPPGAGIPLQGLGEIDAELQTAIAENQADVLSLSFGGPENLNVGSAFNASGVGIAPLEIAALASEGIAVFVSSGDQGAEGCLPYRSAPDPNALCVQYPSTDPNVVSVGGVNTPLNTAGQLIGGITGWGIRTGAYSGSGGGVSAYFPLATYQKGAAGVTGSMRNVPDISLDADGLTGVAVLTYGGSAFSAYTRVSPVGGTSVAAPESAAMWALVLQACKQSSSCATASGPVPYRLGNPNAYFYKIYANSSTYATTFYDVVYGSNNTYCIPTATPCPSPTNPGYSSGQGYDLVTGIGVPYARALIKAVVGK
jgi:subtilase family serine protease